MQEGLFDAKALSSSSWAPNTSGLFIVQSPNKNANIFRRELKDQLCKWWNKATMIDAPNG